MIAIGDSVMSLPFDPEEIFGVAAVDVVRRVACFIGCIAGASGLGALALGLGEAVIDLDPSDVGDWLELSYFLFLAPFISPWVVLYFPAVLASAYVFFTKQSALLRPFLVFLAVESLLIVLAASKYEWECLASVVMWAGCIGAMVWLGLILEQRWRVQAERHLIGVTVENQIRRGELCAKFGTEIRDDYIEPQDGP